MAAGRIVTTHSAPDHSPFYGVILSAPARLPHSERYFRILEFTCLTPGAVLAEVKKLPCKEIDKVMTGTIRTESERIKSDAEQLQSSAKARYLDTEVFFWSCWKWLLNLTGNPFKNSLNELPLNYLLSRKWNRSVQRKISRWWTSTFWIDGKICWHWSPR